MKELNDEEKNNVEHNMPKIRNDMLFPSEKTRFREIFNRREGIISEYHVQ